MTRPPQTVEHWYERNHVPQAKSAEATTARRQRLRKAGKPWDYLPMQPRRKSRRQSEVTEHLAVVAAGAIVLVIYAVTLAV